MPQTRPQNITRAPRAVGRRKLLVRGAQFMLLAWFAGGLGGCSSAPPKQPRNACKIFAEKGWWRGSWKKHTARAARKWNSDPGVMLAIMKQESAFDEDAKPRRKRLLGFIPWKRLSSAEGYAQAIDGTWKRYKDDTNQIFGSRDDFKHAIDFIGWYTAQSRRRLKIRKTDAYRHYLAYHEGWVGYRNGTHRRKKWLQRVAKRVDGQARVYRAQMKRCL